MLQNGFMYNVYYYCTIVHDVISTTPSITLYILYVLFMHVLLHHKVFLFAFTLNRKSCKLTYIDLGYYVIA